ncbi:hypothetical protein LWI28_001909 [Acer negundo]|uniref:Integrase zinc-binding domain-containing protein n=1 Tax=Acer negundo TaxID=4023 RepID=A0AAD5NX87_ACENE|nr:hypothetical protein LWI28_001909 [Acer negundo]
MAITTIEPSWIQEVLDSYQQDPTATTMTIELMVKPPSKNEFSLQYELLRRQRLIYIGCNGSLREKLIEEAHFSAIRGHMRIKDTLKRLPQFFYWGSMNKDAISKVSGCPVCQKCKSEHVKSSSLLQPIHIATLQWQDIAMDFVEGLPTSLGKESILVVINMFTKYAHFLTLTHPYSAAQVANLPQLPITETEYSPIRSGKACLNW